MPKNKGLRIDIHAVAYMGGARGKRCLPLTVGTCTIKAWYCPPHPYPHPPKPTTYFANKPLLCFFAIGGGVPFFGTDVLM